jgi:transcriptional regulator with XRE-family HTH domain
LKSARYNERMPKPELQLVGDGDARANQNKLWISRLGALLRQRRTGRFTVEELATRAGVSAGLVSQIERGIGNPSFATLLRLSQALELPIASMFESPQLDEGQMVVRHHQRRRMVVPADGIVNEMLVPNTNRKLGLIRTVIPAGLPNQGDGVAYSHPGEEIVLVLSGTLHASISGQEFVLEEGDTLSYDAAHAHTWTNRGAEPVDILLFSTPPGSGADH